MAIIGQNPAISARSHRVRVEHPTGTTLDGEGGYTDAWTPGIPADWYVAIESPGAGPAERVAGATVTATALLQVTGPYRADVTVRSRLVRDDGRILSIQNVTETDGRPIELVLACSEVLP